MSVSGLGVARVPKVVHISTAELTALGSFSACRFRFRDACIVSRFKRQRGRPPLTILHPIIPRQIAARLRARDHVVCTERIRRRRQRDGDDGRAVGGEGGEGAPEVGAGRGGEGGGEVFLGGVVRVRWGGRGRGTATMDVRRCLKEGRDAGYAPAVRRPSIP